MWHSDLQRLFPLETQSSEQDRRWLAALFDCTRERNKSYCYLEIGSYWGGSLTPGLIDERCRQVWSIDLRPKVQPDARQALYDYQHVSTATMRERLAASVGKDLSKLITFDGSANDCDLRGAKVELAFIDAEHTDEAVFADFLAIYPALSCRSICAFHDSNLITAGLENILTFIRYLQRPCWFGVFRESSVSAIFLDTEADGVPIAFRSGAQDWNHYKEKSRDTLLMEAIRHRCHFQLTLHEKPVLDVRGNRVTEVTRGAKVTGKAAPAYAHATSLEAPPSFPNTACPPPSS